MTEPIGKVYMAETGEPTCDCGKVVIIYKYVTVTFRGIKVQPPLKTMVGVCECGNTFFGYKPRNLVDV